MTTKAEIEARVLANSPFILAVEIDEWPGSIRVHARLRWRWVWLRRAHRDWILDDVERVIEHSVAAGIFVRAPVFWLRFGWWRLVVRQ